MVSRLILLTTFLLILTTGAEAQWVRSAKSRAFSRSDAIVSDNTGAVFTGGTLTCVTSFGATILQNNSCAEVSFPKPAKIRVDAFLSKHDQNGNLIWVNQYRGSHGNRLFINDIGLDAAGNCYLTGAYSDSLRFNAVPALFNKDSTTEFFLVKIRPTGVTDWAVTFPVDSISETSGQKLSITSTGVYITGYVRGKFQIGTHADSVGRDASFVAAFDFSGNSLWAKNFREINADGSSTGKAIEADGDSIWVFSSFSDSVRIENDTIRGPGMLTTAGIICLYDAAGNLEDSVITTTPFIEGIKLYRPDASLYITGRGESLTAIGDVLFTAAPASAFVSSHDLDLSLKWARQITAPTTTALTGEDIAVNADGSIIVGGTFRGGAITGPTTTASGGSGQNGFVMMLDNTGDDIWLQTFGGTGEDAVVSVASTDDSRIFASGYFNAYVRVVGEEIFGATSSSSNGFMARVDICPQLIANMITADSTYICVSDSSQFQVTNNASYTYQWYKDGAAVTGANTSSFYVEDKGTYRAQITGLGCTKLTPVAKLFLHAPMDRTITTFDQLESCVGDSVQLRSGAQYIFEWMNSGVPILLPDTTQEIIVNMDGDYYVHMTDTFNCTVVSDTFKIRFLPYPLNTISPEAGRHVICRGDSLALHGDTSLPGFNYQWRRDGFTLLADTFSVFQAKVGAIYNVVVSNSAGCQTISLNDTVVVSEPPSVGEIHDHASGQVCVGSFERLITNEVIGQTYQWMRNGVNIPGANGSIFDATGAGQYQVHVLNASCEGFSETFDLTVNPLPAAAIVNNISTAVCEGDAYDLHAQQTALHTYQWLRNGQVMTGSTLPDLPIIQTGNYSVRVTSPFNCQVISPAVTVSVNLPPPASITPQGATTFCTGGQVALRATPGDSFTYQWTRDGSPLVGSTLGTFQAAVSGSYEVSITNANNCTRVSPPLSVQVVPIPVATLVSASGVNTICEHDSLQLLGGSSATYLYSWIRDGQLLHIPAAPNYYATDAGGYQVIASVGNCRDTSAVLSLTLRPNPLPVITRDGEFFSIALFGDIQWFKNTVAISGATQQAILPDEDGSYTVRVINNVGCTAWSGAIPMCYPVPEIRKVNDVLTVSLNATRYTWEYKNIVIGGATQQQLTAQQSGEYSAVVTSNDGCVMETYPVTVCIPFPYITQDDFSGVLKAFPNPASAYQWYYDGERIMDGTTQVHIPADDGSYTVTVTDHEGCTSSSEPFMITPVTGWDDELSSAIKLYPNPVLQKLTVEKPDRAKTLVLIVIDALGRGIYRQEIKESVHQVDFTERKSGAYTIIIQEQRRVAKWRVVKL